MIVRHQGTRILLAIMTFLCLEGPSAAAQSIENPPVTVDSLSAASFIRHTSAVVESLRVARADSHSDRTRQLLDEASAALDSSRFWLGKGAIAAAVNTARVARERARTLAGTLRARQVLIERLARARSFQRALSAQVSGTPLRRAAAFLRAADALLDTAASHLTFGDTHAAYQALRVSEQRITAAQELIRLNDMLTVALPTFYDRLAAAARPVTYSDDDAAKRFYAEARARADTAGAHYSHGRVERAAVAMREAERALGHALFLVELRGRAADQIRRLGARVDGLRESLARDAHRERGIVGRAAELCDSAEVALRQGDPRDALRIAQRTRAGLERLLAPPDGAARIVPADLTLAEAVREVRHLVGQAVAMAREMPVGPQVAMLVEGAVVLTEQITVAARLGDLRTVGGLLPRAKAMARQAIAEMRGDAMTGTPDPETASMIAAGEAAERAAREAARQELAVAEPATVDTTDTVQPAPEPREPEPEVPAEYSVTNAPNPFNFSTTIHFTLPERTEARLVVYNMLGQEVITLVDEELPAGEYDRQWTGTNEDGLEMPTGVYFARLETPMRTVVARMIVSR